MKIKEPLTDIVLTFPLAQLCKECERICTSECCGIDAFDFSPINIATYLTTHHGYIREEDVIALKKQIDELHKVHCSKNLQNIEYSHSIKVLNQFFTTQQKPTAY
jgi:hypothetical protein